MSPTSPFPPLSPEVELLRRQYLQLLDPRSLSIPDPHVLKQPETQSQIFDALFRDGSLAYPPPVGYRTRVLKVLVDALEKAMSDPDEDVDDLTAALASSLSQSPSTSPLSTLAAAREAQRKLYVTYTAPSPLTPSPSASPSLSLAPQSWPPPQEITILESPSLFSSSGTTGLRTWEAAKYLASYLFSTSLIQGKSVIELGAGTGLVSLLAAKWLGARYVLATDGSGEAVEGARDGMFINRLEGEKGEGVMEARVLKWGHAVGGEVLGDEEGEGEGEGGERGFDYVVGADVTFDDRLITPLVSTLHELFESNPGTEGLIAAIIRNEETADKFLKACKSRDFSVDMVASTDHEEKKPQLGLFYSTATEMRIYRIWRERKLA